MPRASRGAGEGAPTETAIVGSAIAIAAVCLLLFAADRAGADENPARPNVLFLLTDDQRADAIAALGNPAVRTPNLDRLVERGFAFRNAYCMGSTMPAVCTPSRHMIDSGRSLFRYDPKRSEGTIGDCMRRAGYATWYLSKRGNTAQAYHKEFEQHAYLDDDAVRRSGHHGRAEADATIDFLEKDWKRDRPFFIYLGCAGPHDPRIAGREWMDLYRRQSLPLPKNYRPFHPFDNGELLVRDEQLAAWPRSEDEIRRHLHDYYACISSIDHNIGRIIDALSTLGELDNTLIVFSSDHGLALGSHGLLGKQSLYEYSMKSPLIFAGPGIPHGSSDALVYLFDIFPTIADLTGTAVPRDLDGRSLAPIIRGEQTQVRETIVLAYRDVQRAVRRGDWKLIRYPAIGYTQLFDLNKDPDELQNLAGDPAHAEYEQLLMKLLEVEQQRAGDTLPLTAAQPHPGSVDLEFFSRAQK